MYKDLGTLYSHRPTLHPRPTLQTFLVLSARPSKQSKESTLCVYADLWMRPTFFPALFRLCLCLTGLGEGERDMLKKVVNRSIAVSTPTLSDMTTALFDRRRVNGPEVSYPPFYEDELPQPAASTSAFASLQEAAVAYQREGRSADDLRPICSCRFSLLSF